MIAYINHMTPADTRRRSPRTAEPSVAAGVARALLALAVAKGADRAWLLARCEIEAAALDDQDARIPLEQWLALMRRGSEACGDPALALHFGEAFDVADMSVVGLMSRAADTKSEGLEVLNRFCRLVIDVEIEGEDRFRLVREGGETWMVDTRLNPNETPEIGEAGFAQMAAMGRLMLPGGKHFRAVHFTHPAPAYRGEYERIFEVPVVFGSDRNAFLMPAGWESEPIALEPHYALDILSAHAQGLLERLDDAGSTARAVEAWLVPRLARGRSDAAAAADGLGLSKQTLYRRLRAENTSFERLLAGLRHKLAVRYVRDEKLTAKETGYRLGFSDPAAFSRAFKRWTGASPSAFRRGAG